MRKIMRKIFWVWDFEKEEQWLNEMAAKGMSLISAGFCRFEFEQTPPGEYAVRLQLLDRPCRRAENEQYISFLEETGAEHVGSCMRWAYFRKKKAQGEFELFSDKQSHIRYLRRIERLLVFVGGINLLLGVMNLLLFALHGMNGNLIGLANLLLGALCLSGLLQLNRKVKKLRQEQQLFE